MKTEDLLRYTYKIINNKNVLFTNAELTDRRRLLRRILKDSMFESCTDVQLDNMTAQQLKDGRYLVSDSNGYEFTI